MKIRKAKIKQLLKLNLLRSKVYEQPIKKLKFDNLIDSALNQIIVDVKKVLQTIFKYNQIKKRILFVGLPYKLELKINQYTRHVAIPKDFEVQGMISNCTRKSLKNPNQICLKDTSKFLFPKLTKRLDLIVLLEHDRSKTIFSESEAAKIPLILFGTSFNILGTAFYKIEGNFKDVLSASNKNIFFIGLNFLFKNSREQNLKHF